MNKKIIVKILALTLLSFSLISCGTKNNISKSNNESQSYIKEEEGNRNENSLPSDEEKNNSNQGNETSIKQDDSTNKDTKNPELFIVAGGPNEVPGVCEYSLAEIKGGPKIKPPVSNKNSTCYIVETDDKIYIDVILEVRSLMDKAEVAGDMITTKIKIKNSEYNSFSLVESTDGTKLERDALINPLETKRIHYLSEVPVEDSVTGEFEIILTIKGKEFSNKFSLDSLQPSIKESMQEALTQSLSEEEYYNIIKEVKQRQLDYINSIKDPNIKQSVQTPLSAAIAESTFLYIKYPDDIDTIDIALKRVLNEE